MIYETPCKASDTPDDWFLGKDGKQYPDDELVADQDAVTLLAMIDPDGTQPEEVRIAALARLEEETKKGRLRSRRDARAACHTCYFRMQCLDIALTEPTPATHGTWGGYFEEELKELRKQIRRRKNSIQ